MKIHGLGDSEKAVGSSETNSAGISLRTPVNQGKLKRGGLERILPGVLTQYHSYSSVVSRIGCANMLQTTAEARRHIFLIHTLTLI